MKALILGTDFLKDADGSLRIVETNTNVDIHNKIVPDLDWASFKQLLIDNSINSLHLIATDGNFITNDKENVFDETTVDVSLKDAMQSVMNEIGGTFNYYEVAKNSITVPYVEDSPNTLIIRTAYDTTAIVDEQYAKDKVNFHKLIQNTSYSPKVYYSSTSDSSLNIDQLTTLHITTGDTPNYVVKTRYPNTDYVKYPALYKITSLEDLQTLKNSLTNSEYIEEYHTHSDNFVNDKIGVIRSLDILYGGNLNCLHLGSYIMTSPIKSNLWETTYDANGKMSQNSRPMWLTKAPSPKGGASYILDDDTKILYADGSMKFPNQLLQNDLLKTIKFPWIPENETSETGEPLYIPDMNSGSFSTDVNTFEVSSSSIIDVGNQIKETFMIRVTLENGIVYEDLPGSAMMIEEYDTLETTFSFTNRFRLNDSLVFFDYNNNQLTKSKITNLEIVYITRNVYDLNVELNDIFLPVADESLGLAFIQHNGQCFGWCGSWMCYVWCCSTCYFCYGPPPKL